MSEVEISSVSDKIEDDCCSLIFPKEFDKCETLLISEVHMLLDHRNGLNQQVDDEDKGVSEVFSKAYNYTQVFSSYQNVDSISVVRNILSKSLTQLHPFEIASLANLRPSSADEAKKLIPSLETRIDDFELQEMLDEIKPFINAQT